MSSPSTNRRRRTHRTADGAHFDRRGERLRGALEKTPGLRLLDAHRGELRVGGSRARLQVEAGDWIRVSLSVSRTRAPGPLEALRRNHRLAGNTRFAGASRALSLVADTRLDGGAHLARSLAGIRASLASASGARRRRGASEARGAAKVDAAALETALDGLGWDDAVVRLEDGWELRPRLQGEALPVCLEAEETRLRLSRRILSELPQGRSAEAVAELALRFNRQLRLARLALDGDGKGLVAETCLENGLASSGWLAAGARAVAAASQHTETALRIVSDDEDVAQCCVRFFLP